MYSNPNHRKECRECHKIYHHRDLNSGFICLDCINKFNECRGCKNFFYHGDLNTHHLCNMCTQSKGHKCDKCNQYKIVMFDNKYCTLCYIETFSKLKSDFSIRCFQNEEGPYSYTGKNYDWDNDCLLCCCCCSCCPHPDNSKYPKIIEMIRYCSLTCQPSTFRYKTRYRCATCEVSYGEWTDWTWGENKFKIKYCNECVDNYCKTNVKYYFEPKKTIKGELINYITVDDLVDIIIDYISEDY